MSGFIVLSQGNSIFLSVVSFIGVIFLAVLGRLFAIEHPTFTESINSPKDPQAVAQSCYQASLIYFLTLLFTCFQAYLHTRKSQNAVRL